MTCRGTTRQQRVFSAGRWLPNKVCLAVATKAKGHWLSDIMVWFVGHHFFEDDGAKSWPEVTGCQTSCLRLCAPSQPCTHAQMVTHFMVPHLDQATQVSDIFDEPVQIRREKQQLVPAFRAQSCNSNHSAVLWEEQLQGIQRNYPNRRLCFSCFFRYKNYKAG